MCRQPAPAKYISARTRAARQHVKFVRLLTPNDQLLAPRTDLPPFQTLTGGTFTAHCSPQTKHHYSRS